MATTALRIGDTVRSKSTGETGRLRGLLDNNQGSVQMRCGLISRFALRDLERVDIASLAEEIASGSAERSIRMPAGTYVLDGKVVLEPTLSYLRNQPLATARMTPHEALLLAQSLIDSAAKALGRA